MAEYKKYTIIISIFLLLIAGIAFLFKERLLQGFNHNQELNSVIILIFILGVMLIYRNIILMSKEQKWLYAFLKNKNTAINYSPRLLDNFKKIFYYIFYFILL